MPASSSRGPSRLPAPPESPDAVRGSHVVQFYESDAFLVDQVSRFIVSGFDAGDGLVVIAERSHRDDLEERLASFGIELAAASGQGRYVALDAVETMAQISTGGRVRRARFFEVVGGAIERVARARARVRAFGEMVALLWRDGRRAEALELERLWNELASKMGFSLLCAYPVAACEAGAGKPDLLDVCNEHDAALPAHGASALVAVETLGNAVAQLRQKADALVRQRVHLARERFERARLAAIVESSNDAIMGKTLDGVVTTWNEAARRMFGYTAEEMIGQPIHRLLPPDRIDELDDILARIRAGERVEHFETERVRKDGRRIHVSLTVSPIEDATGVVVGASKIARDISERKRAEDELRQHREALETISRVGLSLAAELDLEKLLHAVTDAATRLAAARYGAFLHRETDDRGERYTVRAASGAPRSAFADADGAPHGWLLGPARDVRGVVRLDDLRREVDVPDAPAGGGDVVMRSYMAVPIVGRGHGALGALVLGDPLPGAFSERAERLVTGLAAHAAVAIDNARLYEAERRLRSEAEAASRAKDEFLAMLGHELRNPLSSVRNAIVTASLDPSRRERALGIARRGADQLARLVDDLLDVARISRGMITLQRARVRVADVVERAVETTRELVAERGHELEVMLPGAPLDVEGDQTRLEQVLVNLITNSAKYTEPGGHIVVRAERSGDEAVLRVEDDGTGIAADVLPRVFDLFCQGKRGLQRAQGGLGVGLTVVRRLVELHGGRVEAYSAGLGKGAQFVVRLPAPAATQRDAVAPSAARQTGAEQRARVLLVEDHPDVAESMSLLLELLGHQVEVVHDGLVAVEVARDVRPDVVLIDIGLPGIDGYEVARRMREDDRIAHAKLVALTGYGREEDKARALAAGFDHHLTKPVEFDALSELVAALPPRPPLSRSSLVH